MHHRRPVYLNLFRLRLPLPGLVSILHRISGMAVFFIIPSVLWVFSESLASESGFQEWRALLQQPFVRFIVWGFLMSLIFHLLAGIRHLMMDIHLGHSLKGARLSAKVVLVLAAIYAIGLMIWMWGSA